jgi:predicted acyltransferase
MLAHLATSRADMQNPNKKYIRLLSLDVFRGITVALMILVNSPGNQTTYSWLDHSAWHGCTLADLVFPFFIFIVGVSTTFTLSKARTQNFGFKELFPKILQRSLLLFAVGLLLNAFPYHFDLSTIRVFGVLQRIAICYFVASVLFLTTRVSTQAIIMLFLVIGYWLIMMLIPSYDLSPQGNIAAHMDRMLFSAAHLYGKFFDPEGFLSTFPAIATALLGNLTGVWLLSTHNHNLKLAGMTIAGFFALLAGWVWGLYFPINKALWTSSYVLWTAGLALLVLAFCYWLIEMKALKKWARPFELFGLNAMLAYVLHVLFLKIQAIISLPRPDGSPGNLRLFITDHFFSWVSSPNASLLYACSYTLLWLLMIQLFAITVKTRRNK